MMAADQPSPAEERTWVVRARDGDQAAFARLVEVYDRRLLYFVLRFLPDADRALDVLQDVWLTLFRRLPGLRAPEAFRVWLYQIAHDRVVDVVRRERRQEALVEELGHECNGVAEGPALSLEQAEFVHHALDLLRPEHREVLLLRFLEDLSIQEMADTLRLSIGTVKSRLHYARLALRREMEELVRD
jgi:RNA polymerase sigma-70 factor (ECF subfamily)